MWSSVGKNGRKSRRSAFAMAAAQYTVEGLFNAAEQSARRSDVLEVGYDPQYGYPAMMRGIGKLGLPDNWFWVKASRLTPAR